MPFLIDGNNLMFALRKAGADVGRSGVVSLLALLADAGERVTVVFDGAAPAGPLAQQVEDPRVAIVYASPQSADECIMQFIAADSAPRRLTVVSTDHELRRAARKRRCPSALSEDFAELLGFVREIRFDRLGVFCYSLEKETPASKFLNPVSEEVADDRRHEIMKVQAEISLSKNLLLKGAVIDVGIDSIRGNIATGRTYRDAPDIDNTVILRIPQKKNVSPGDRVRAKIESVSDYELKGEIL